jgi:hypothetical protein
MGIGDKIVEVVPIVLHPHTAPLQEPRGPSPWSRSG